MVEINRKNYHSPESSRAFMGSSQFKNFMACPSRAIASIDGEYSVSSDALLQGQLLDAYFEGNVDELMEEHPEMVSKRGGGLLKKFELAGNAYETIKNDPKMFELCSGEQQVIQFGEISGVPFKVMYDSLLPDRIIDRKFMRDFSSVWVEGEGRLPWWKAWGYEIQGAIYREIARQNGRDLDFEIVAISKERVPDKRYIHFSDKTLNDALEVVKANAPTFQAYKDELIDAPACGHCEWCNSHKLITDAYEEV